MGPPSEPGGGYYHLCEPINKAITQVSNLDPANVFPILFQILVIKFCHFFCKILSFCWICSFFILFQLGMQGRLYFLRRFLAHRNFPFLCKLILPDPQPNPTTPTAKFVSFLSFIQIMLNNIMFNWSTDFHRWSDVLNVSPLGNV